jgi:hypothetical protein
VKETIMDERKTKKMLGVALLRLVVSITPDDVKELKAGGCADEAKVLLEALDRVYVKWQEMEPVDKKGWVIVRMRLNELRVTLRGG